LLPADDGPPRPQLTIPAKRSRPRDADPVRHRLPIGGGSHGPEHLTGRVVTILGYPTDKLSQIG